MASSADQLPCRYTVDEYLRRERESVEKHEYDDGIIVPRAQSSLGHVLLTGNVASVLNAPLVYPDVSVICGEPAADPDDSAGDSYLNPRLIVEVLSPSTERYDRRGSSTATGRSSRSASTCWSPRTRRGSRHNFRSDDGAWAFDVVTGVSPVAKLRSLKIDLPLAEVYANVTFLPLPPEPEDGAGPPTTTAETTPTI